jgi:MoxR-like ATPase
VAREKVRMEQPRIQGIIDHMNRIFLGQQDVVNAIVCAMLAGGHVLLEGVPGVGKTLIGLAMSRLLGLSFKRIQFTNDLLPSDITGFHTVQGAPGDFTLVRGPVFAHIVLADEINRTSPKTQSALLEAMEEQKVTIDGITYELPSPFMVIATQNPFEVVGTFPLPESQMDRFLFRLPVGYPPLDEEMQILARGIDHKDALGLQPVTAEHELTSMMGHASRVQVHKDVLGYMTSLIRSTRAHPKVELGVSPRGGLALKKAAQAWAFMHGRDFLTPGDVKAIAPLVLAHRIIPKDGNPLGIVEALIHETGIPL